MELTKVWGRVLRRRREDCGDEGSDWHWVEKGWKDRLSFRSGIANKASKGTASSQHMTDNCRGPHHVLVGLRKD